MMQNKRFTALLPALLAALCLAACSRDPSVFSSSSPSSGGPTAVSAADPAGESQAQSEPEEDPLLSESIAKQLMGGAYYIDGTSVIEIEGFRLENAVTIAVDKGNSAVKTTSEMSGALTTMRVVTLDGTTWLVNDTSKTCTKVDRPRCRAASTPIFPVSPLRSGEKASLTARRCAMSSMISRGIPSAFSLTQRGGWRE